jgi:mannose-1-phosphate guanylyltransferase
VFVRAMLVAAGFGTRLDPLTQELPKPALPLGNRPVAWFALDHLRRIGTTDVTVNTHHLADRLQGELEQVVPDGMRLRFVHEPEILGTGGGVRNALRPQPGEDVFLVNAKLAYAPDLARALSVHRQSGAIATMVLRALPPGSGFSPIEVDAEGRVRSIRKLPGFHGGLALRMFTGVAVLSARAFHDLPERGDIIEHAYLPWLARGELVASITDDSPWVDVGVTPRHYLDANLALASGALRWPGVEPGPEHVLRASGVELGPGSRLEHAVVGRGATIAGGCSVLRSVVWPCARVTESCASAIVTTAGRVLGV